MIGRDYQLSCLCWLFSILAGLFTINRVLFSSVGLWYSSINDFIIVCHVKITLFSGMLCPKINDLLYGIVHDVIGPCLLGSDRFFL